MDEDIRAQREKFIWQNYPDELLQLFMQQVGRDQTSPADALHRANTALQYYHEKAQEMLDEEG